VAKHGAALENKAAICREEELTFTKHVTGGAHWKSIRQECRMGGTSTRAAIIADGARRQWPRQDRFVGKSAELPKACRDR